MRLHLPFLFSLLLASTNISAQKAKVGDYIESFSFNKPSDRDARPVQYVPDNGDFLCINGKNRFTRALYGNETEYRIETSDKPIFALFKAKNYRSLRFYIDGVQLDSVDYCEARYGKGMRTYLMKDKRWGRDAILTLEVVMNHGKEEGYFLFKANGFGKDVTLDYKLCNITAKKLSRNGDIGADKPGIFEPSKDEENLVCGTMVFGSEVCAVTMPHEDKSIGHTVTLSKKDTPTIMQNGASASKKSLRKRGKGASTTESNDDVFATIKAEQDYYAEYTKRISFITPDPMINTLGSTLVLAADGAWDGETWLHGAIGWRMPLAGWRAGYLGDVLGWNGRAISHFDAYAKSQVTNVEPTIPAPSQDEKNNLARGEEKWGTQMYSNGYICRYPNKNTNLHHYDMNLNYIDELLWHFEYDADTAYMKKMWPVLKLHLVWEKRNFDRDNNHLYDAYCCIWASDALYYNGGEVTHSSAYNYRGNLLAAKIARMIGEDPTPYQQEADAILKAMNESLWVSSSSSTLSTGVIPHWAEYKDVMGLQRVHPNAALWSIYTPIDCGVGTPEQMYSCTEYVDKQIPHLAVEIDRKSTNAAYNQTIFGNKEASIISTSNWMPYSWSINNVASAEIMHTALAFFKAGRSKEGFELVKGNILDQMYLGASPGNLGQISYYDAARGESYRDFGDNIGISARAIVQGLFGIVPNALDGKCMVRPGFPLEWDSVEVSLPYLTYKYKRVGDKATLTLHQNFTNPLQLIVRVNGDNGSYTDYAGTNATDQVIEITVPEASADAKSAVAESAVAKGNEAAVPADLAKLFKSNEVLSPLRKSFNVSIPYNARVTDIFKPQYVSPRPASTSLEIPIQGIGEWCHPKFTVEINDSAFAADSNVLFASLWDNYPSEVTIPLKKKVKAQSAQFLIAGSTNHMQFDLDNALIIAHYTDNTTDTLALRPPYNYCPIEQDYFIDGRAFGASLLSQPLRVSLMTGKESLQLGREMGVPESEVYGREIKGGAAQRTTMTLNPQKKLSHFTLKALSNDIVVGIMSLRLDVE